MLPMITAIHTRVEGHTQATRAAITGAAVGGTRLKIKTKMDSAFRWREAGRTAAS